MADQNQNPFPKNFLWGAATSAHQVEGNNHNDWSEWEKRGLVKHAERSGLASGHYDRFQEDFSLAKELGHNAHRFSIEWSRIEPRRGEYDRQAIAHYRQVLEELHRLKITPIVTLHHFTHPVWAAQAGGWESNEVVDRFAHFVTLMMREVGHLAEYWITINEPTVYTSFSYLTDWWPPQKGNAIRAWHIIRQLVVAHRLAYHIIHRHFPHAKVGVANNLNDFVPARPENLLDRGLTVFSRYWHNQWWLDQTYQTQDFIGLNYYFHHRLRFRVAGLMKLLASEPQPNALHSDLGWEIHPAGLTHVLQWLKRYNRPVIITENGLADAGDVHRAQFIKQHVAAVAAALRAGVDVRGYLHWSLLDNFEWREGFDPRFGLVEVDYHSLKRTIRPSAYTYRQIIQSNGQTALS